MLFKYQIVLWLEKHKIFLMNILFFLLFFWRPIKKNKIIFCCHNGMGYGCNPKYIVEEIIKQKLQVELVWLVTPDFINSEEFPKEIKLVDYSNLYKSMKELSTSAIWVDNAGKTFFFKKGLIKKKGQTYINTWHGSLGIKRLDFDIHGFKNYQALDIETKEIDIFLSNCEFETNVFRKSKHYKNVIAEIGHPRNDILINQNKDLKSKILSKLGLEPGVVIVFYAPSFREDRNIKHFNLDYEKIKRIIEDKYRKKCLILTRYHSQNLDKLSKLNQNKDFVKDVSKYHDIQELLYIADILISDYSSCMFDILFKQTPCFVYAEDIEEYNNIRGFYYPLEETPFPIASNNDELIYNIQNFNENEYKEKCRTFLSERHVIDDGNASKRAVDLIKRYISV